VLDEQLRRPRCINLQQLDCMHASRLDRITQTGKRMKSVQPNYRSNWLLQAHGLRYRHTAAHPAQALQEPHFGAHLEETVLNDEGQNVRPPQPEQDRHC
jgi:hypothetical protein